MYPLVIGGRKTNSLVPEGAAIQLAATHPPYPPSLFKEKKETNIGAIQLAASRPGPLRLPASNGSIPTYTSVVSANSRTNREGPIRRACCQCSEKTLKEEARRRRENF